MGCRNGCSRRSDPHHRARADVDGNTGRCEQCALSSVLGANALKTFQAFIKAASDDGTRDAVLLETTRSIFALSPTGYLDTGEPSSEPVSKLMEIVRTPAARAGA